MEDKDWFWQDDSFKLDTESPLAISRSLWDGLAQSEADSRSLFETTPSAEIMDSDHLLSTLSRQGCGRYDASNSPQEGSPRSKRRRMLFPGAMEESAISGCFSDAVLDSSFSGQGAAVIPSCEDLVKNGVAMPASPRPLWYQHDDPHFTLNEVLDSQKWVGSSFGEFQGSDPYDDRMKLAIPIIDMSGSCSDYQQPSSSDSDTMDWPSTPFARSPIPGRRPSAPLARPKSVTPVAYPFALLKPCGAQGDVTLNDINQRISRPPSQPQLGTGDSRHSLPQPSTSLSGSSQDPSGKSVVGLTKIHTEGNGTITIVRTRGG